MASKRQVAANRRNAQKSTGPRSASGRKRSSQNAYRHGLSSRISGANFEKQLEILARQIAGDADDTRKLVFARDAAEAKLELQRIRKLKTAMIERIMAHGSFDGPKYFQSKKEQRQWFKANFAWMRGRGPLPPLPGVIDASATMPKEEPDRLAEAVRRLLPEFVSLLRYENRATGRRDQAIRNMMRIEARTS